MSPANNKHVNGSLRERLHVCVCAQIFHFVKCLYTQMDISSMQGNDDFKYLGMIR